MLKLQDRDLKVLDFLKERELQENRIKRLEDGNKSLTSKNLELKGKYEKIEKEYFELKESFRQIQKYINRTMQSLK